MIDVGQLIAFEQGEQDAEDTITMFQAMIDDRSVWQLQGSYGRLARDLIEVGHCHA